jgi:hypothetical protein
MTDYERLGVFYLGKPLHPETRALLPEPLLYPSKHLTTHAVVLGMTGSGKTGLSVGILEEAALDGIPAICIDPKGDLGNMMLTFPDLAPADFRPWIDVEEANRSGISPDEFAAKTAASWAKGLADWQQDGERIRRLREAAEVTVYTPGSSAGVPLALLRSFDAPRGEVDEETLRERVSAAVSGLLGLLGIDADPLQSREHILLSRILHDAWVEGQGVDLGALILAVQKPAFDRVGVLDLESFFPGKERAALAMGINNLLASPGAQSWMQGEPLDIGRMLVTPAGKPRISIVSIGHLSDEQRMFFVATLLSEMVAWMRAQGGTSSTRALLFMDEIYGYFPPSANPPSKGPMLTLLKQARAFGLGVVLATQNPVDLDYKGLANCGTWFIGRLQTDRDKMRVLDGLEGASAASGNTLDRAAMDDLLSSLGKRVFLLHSVHADAPVLFQTRWTLSFLRGPITREEIKRLTQGQKAAAPAVRPAHTTARPTRPAAPQGVEERFHGNGSAYSPWLHGVARVHYVDARQGIDHWEELSLMAPLSEESPFVLWNEAESVEPRKLGDSPSPGAIFDDLPAHVGKKSAPADWKKGFAAWIYQDRPTSLLHNAFLGLTSKPGENEAAFRQRLAHAARERRDEAVAAFEKKMAPKFKSLDERLKKAEARVGKEKADAQAATVNTVTSWGTAIFGSLFGRGSAVTKVASAARTTSRSFSAQSDVEAAEAAARDVEESRDELEAEVAAEVARLTAEADPAALTIGKTEVVARKADTQVLLLQLVWKADA